MTDSIDPRGDQMAADLIDHVKRTHTPRLALLEDRIAAAIEYMNGVTAPNMYTLDHIRRYLDGGYDSVIDLRADIADRIEDGS